MRVASVEIDWHAVLSTNTSNQFSNTVGNELGWLRGHSAYKTLMSRDTNGKFKTGDRDAYGGGYIPLIVIISASENLFALAPDPDTLNCAAPTLLGLTATQYKHQGNDELTSIYAYREKDSHDSGSIAPFGHHSALPRSHLQLPRQLS